jgi:hypothetical protein
MCLRFAFLLTARVFSWLRLSQREDTWNTAEILILRHQLAVLQRRQPRRPNLNGANANPSPLVAGSLGTRAEIDSAVSSTSSSNSTGAPKSGPAAADMPHHPSASMSGDACPVHNGQR